MTPERWQKVKEILEQTEEHPVAERQAWLHRVCGDSELRREVESLLAFEDDLDGFIEEPVMAAVSRAVDEREALPELRKVGPFRLLSLLGRGGMGSVYLAARQEDFEQRVALKLLSPGLASESTIRRFEAERQILARLEHPNIARLLDGGTSAEGLPYFAMEVVEGLPIDHYCVEKKLSLRARLELILEVCSALQLAHQNLIIHRDLKPGNILVDTAGVPKLLDFGIAKILLEDNSVAAPTAQAFTVFYASPEQLKGEPIGTTSDVYSLGVVLFQVLTGALPLAPEGRGHFEIMRAICEEEPALASAVVGRGEASLYRSLSGDVDAILAKALRKEPAQRYASVENLANDIRSHLDNRPVKARAGNSLYYFGKYLRRHRFAVAGAIFFLLLVLGFTAALLRQLRETEKARVRAEGVSNFLVDLFQAAAPDRQSAAEPTLRQLLSRGRQNLELGLDLDPQERATLSLKLGEVYYKLGDYAEAETLLAEAIKIWRRESAGENANLAAAVNDLAMVYYARGEYARAETLLRECIALRRQFGREEDLLKPMNNLAAILLARGEVAEAEEIYRESLTRRRAALGPRHKNVATSLRSLASVLLIEGKPEQAEPLLREALSIREEVFGPTSPPVAAVLLSLAKVDENLGHLEAAQALQAKALAIYRDELGEDHLETARAKKDWAEVSLKLGQQVEACRLLEEALDSLKQIRPAGDKEVQAAEALLASCADPGKIKV